MVLQSNKEIVFTWLLSTRDDTNISSIWYSVPDLYHIFQNHEQHKGINYASFNKQLSTIEKVVDYIEKNYKTTRKGY